MGATFVASERTAARSGAAAWHAAVAVLLVCGVVYSRTWTDLWPLWMDTEKTTYTHGLLIALVSVWLVLRSRQALGAKGIRPLPMAIPLVLLLSLAWMVFAGAGVLTAYVALWPLLAGATLLAACGWNTARTLAFPLAYLWFAMPILEHLNPILQRLTVLAVDLFNRLTMVPATVNGDVVTIPSGQFHIAAGCSGLHFFIVGLAIAALAGEIHRDRPGIRILLLAIGAALSMLANWLRVYFVILAGHMTEMQHHLVRDHYRFGWLVFAVTMVIFLWIVRRIPAPSRPALAPEPASAPRRPLAWATLAVAAALIVPTLSWLARAEESLPATAALVAPRLDGFTGPVTASPGWRPLYFGPESEVRAAYVSQPGRVIDFYGNRYLAQAQGSELIGYRNRLVPEDAFGERSRSSARISTDGGQRSFNRLDATASATGEDWVFLYHYYVGNKWLQGSLATQLATGWSSLWGTEPAGVLVVAAPCRGACEQAVEELASLLVKLSGGAS